MQKLGLNVEDLHVDTFAPQEMESEETLQSVAFTLIPPTPIYLITIECLSPRVMAE